MAVHKSKCFYKRERGQGDEHWYRLCFDEDSGRMFVHEEASTNSGGVFSTSEREIELADFMQGGGDRQGSLVALFKTLG